MDLKAIVNEGIIPYNRAREFHEELKGLTLIINNFQDNAIAAALVAHIRQYEIMCDIETLFSYTRNIEVNSDGRFEEYFYRVSKDETHYLFKTESEVRMIGENVECIFKILK